MKRKNYPVETFINMGWHHLLVVSQDQQGCVWNSILGTQYVFVITW